MQSDVLITWIRMIATTPPIPEWNKLKGLHWKSPHLFQRNASFCYIVLHICICGFCLELTWILLSFRVAVINTEQVGASVAQWKTCTEKKTQPIGSEYSVCVCSLFADFYFLLISQMDMHNGMT